MKTRNDEAYSVGAYIKDGDSYPARWANAAAAFRVAAKGSLDVPYGARPREVMDWFLPRGVPKGSVVFVHGGYWKQFGKSDWSHLAAGSLAHGWSVVMLSYDLCPEMRISEITRQIASAVGQVAAETEGPVRLVGHSAGGHLVARMGQILEAPTLDRIVPISPLSDLRPLLETSMNADLRLDHAEATTESPALGPRPDVPVSVWVGGAERPAFIEQAMGLGQAWGCPVHTSAGMHHFNIIDSLMDPKSDLMRDLLS